jgi:UDP:flavonoid glycosyltransferase YjiC (YdhE family)
VSSIVIAGFPAHGHVTPLLTVAENFCKRGDDVRFITGSLFADRVAATGASYVPLPAEADFDDQPLAERFPNTSLPDPPGASTTRSWLR